MNRKITSLTSKIVPLIVSTLLLVIIFWLVGTKDVIQKVAIFPAWGVAMILVLYGLNLIVVTFRLSRVLHHFSLILPFRIVTRANISGHVAGLFFISLFGQVAGRHYVLTKSGIPSVVVASLSAYERVVALLVSGSLALLGSTILLDSFMVKNFLDKIPLIELAFATVGSLALSLLFCRSKFESNIIRRALTWRKLKDAIEISALTLLGRLLVLTAFFISVSLLNPDVNHLHLFSAAAITSFVANLPFTIHGWGLRELAAVFTLGLLGIPSSEALAVSILIGLSSTAVIIIVAPFILNNRDSSTTTRKTDDMLSGNNDLNIEKSAAWMISMAAAILVFFRYM